MARDPDEEWREALVELLGRPVLLVFWSLVLWGTLYGSLLILAAVTEGLRATLQRTLSGRDLLGGLVNLTLAAGAAVVWIGVAVAVRRRRRSKGFAERKWAERMNVQAVTAMLHVQSVPRAVAFYEKLGFVLGNTHTPEGSRTPSTRPRASSESRTPTGSC